ncbi:MAG: hypothetical protein JSV12_03440 [Candidatus Bathyarchaeota archaeon]|nr:MAG: hypothetical protein JSV12_03440 [Candidatus Bathyarchaeota archaeon]
MKKVRVKGKQIEVIESDGIKKFEINDLPKDFTEWQVESRKELFNRIEKGEFIAMFGVHLPVLVTLDQKGTFPFNTGNRGAGLVPKAEHLESYLHSLRESLTRTKEKPWKESLRDRLSTIKEIYSSPENFDKRMLGGLEIFEGKAYKNMLESPLVSLHYTGPGPTYRSYQVNCITEILPVEDSRYQFLHLTRRLFEHESFHIPQPEFPFGYIFWVCEVHDKTPQSKIKKPST